MRSYHSYAGIEQCDRSSDLQRKVSGRCTMTFSTIFLFLQLVVEAHRYGPFELGGSLCDTVRLCDHDHGHVHSWMLVKFSRALLRLEWNHLSSNCDVEKTILSSNSWLPRGHSSSSNTWNTQLQFSVPVSSWPSGREITYAASLIVWIWKI